MATLLQVAQLGHPVLRKKAKPVENIKDLRIQTLIDDLLATLLDASGVGIAAPQVYQSIRLFIVASHPNPRYPNAPMMKPTPVINPKILTLAGAMKKDWEGCLSVPGIRGFVPRHTNISVEFTDRKGKRVKRTFADFIARIFQHEYDHLEGIEFLDRLESTKDIITDKEYQKRIAQKK
jgi:peptide deformylase